MKIQTVRNLIVTFIALFFTGCLYAQTTYTWNLAGNGSWATAGNWTPARTTPAVSDILIINNGGTKTITAVPTQTIGRLVVSGNTTVTLEPNGGARTLTLSNAGLAMDVQTGSTLSLTGQNLGGTRSLTLRFAAAGNTVSIAGTLNLNITGNDPGIINFNNSVTTVTGTLSNNGGTIGAAAGNLNFTGSSNYTHAVNGNGIPVATWTGNATCTITGFTTTLPTGLNQSFARFVWDCASQTGPALFAGQLTAVAGDLVIRNSALQAVVLASTNNSTYTLAIGGNLVVEDNAWFLLTYGDNITATVNVTNDFTITGSSMYSTMVDFHAATGSGITLAKIILNVGGDYIQTSGYMDMAYGESNVSNFTEMRINGNFSLSADALLQTGSGDNSVINGLLLFNRNGSQTLFVDGTSYLQSVNYQVDNTSILQLQSDISLSSSATAGFAGQFTIATGGTVDAGTFRIVSSSGATAGVNNRFELQTGGKIITANAGGLQTDATNGTVSTAIANRIYHSSADYEFQTGITGVFSTTPTANTLSNLIVNNSSGNVVLSQPVTITHSLQLVNGILVSTLTNLLTIADNATATGGSYAPVRYVDGPVRKTGDDAFTFPVGKNNIYAPASISAPAAVTAEYRGEYFRGTPPNRTNITAPGLSQISYCEYWDIEEVGPGSPTVDVSLSWSGLSPCNAAAYVTSLTSLTVAHFDGTNWNSHGNSGGFSGTATQGNVTRNTVAAFSIFTLGSTSAAANPLSVKMTDLAAWAAGTQNRISWTNRAEAGIAEYAIEKSTDGLQFVALVQQQARSNNGSKESYTVTDLQPGQVTYYRIRATENSGQISYSQVLKVSRNTASANSIKVFPNPVVNKQVTVQLNSRTRGLYQIKLYSNSGQQLLSKSWQYNGGGAAQTLDLPEQLQAGVYHLQVSGETQQLYTALLVQ